jgi:eukaryotic-like serine/threonine-protein kinase
VLTPGDLLGGKYKIISVIGEGGFGKVYLGYDESILRYVAVKELLRSAATVSPEDQQDYELRFRREARTISQFAHPNVVSAYALETDEHGDLYLVLEYVDGGNLKQLIESGDLPPIERVVDIAIDLCNAIDAIYQRDIVHRDIKPSNILLTREGMAKLTDFGVAQVGHETRRTQDAVGHPGTPAYKSPEQATTTGYLDERSDLYALGLVVYELLTGRLYVRNRVRPGHVNRDVPDALDAIVMKALEPDPARRYQSALAMRRDLEYVRDQSTWGQLQIVVAKLPPSRVASLVGILLVFALTAGLMMTTHPAPPATVARALPTAPAAIAPTASVPIILQATLPVSATGTATPTLRVDLGDVYEPDDEVPVPIALGETQHRSFNPEGDIDRVTFRARARHSYLVSTSNLATGVDTRIEVQVDAQTFSSDDAAPGVLTSQVAFVAPVDGTAIVTVYNQDLYGPTRTYDLSVIEISQTPTPMAALTTTLTLTPTLAAPTFTPRPTFTPVPSVTPTRTLTRTPTNTYTPWPTSTPWPSSTPWPTDTETPTLTPWPTDTPTLTPTVTPTPTLTPTRTSTPTPTNTPTPTRTSLPVKTTLPPAK